MYREALATNKKRNVTIDRLKGFAAILVVVGHTMSFLIKNDIGSDGALNALQGSIYCIHVPLFFFLSGYLCHKQNLKEFYRKKLLRIAIPFLFFTTLKIIYSAFISEEYAHGSSILQQLFEGYVVGSFYWFCYAILLAYLISPLIWGSGHKYNRRIIIIEVIAIALSLIMSFSDIDTGLVNIFSFKGFIMFLPYYLNGMLLQKNKDWFKRLIDKHKGAIITASAIVVICSIACYWYFVPGNYNFIIKLVSAHAYIFLLYLVFDKFKTRNIRIMKMAGDYSLQIMLFDSFYKVFLCAILLKFIGASMLTVLIASVLDVLLCVYSCEIIRKIKYFNALFGLQKN